MRGYLWLLLICLVVLAPGCTPKPYRGEALDLHGRMSPDRVDIPSPRLSPSPGALGPEEPYLPLVQPPEVRRVWITAHLNEAGDLIAGHWVYLMLSPSSWLFRDYQGPQEFRLKLPAPTAVESLKEGN